jgi:hypothetical protein
MTMAEESTGSQAPTPNPRLKSLDRLVGTWSVSGPTITGQVRFEWMDGGFFLMQHVDMMHDGNPIKGLEIIGFERGWEVMMGMVEVDPLTQDITSHWFDNVGDSFSYTWEIKDDTLTIWGGERGSPAYYQGKFSADGNINSGAWVYPGGGGYESTMTRVGK